MKTHKSVKILIAILVVLLLPTTVIALTATTGPQSVISFNDMDPDTITRPAGDFTADGFMSGQCIIVTGSAHNDGMYTIAVVAVLTLTLIPSDQLIPEAAGATVNITQTVYRVIIQKAGAGSGTVTSTPAGIDCGGTCSAYFCDGSEVTLTAAPDAGSAFDGFSGGGCLGNGECTFLLDQDYTITATFNPDADSDGISDLREDGGPNGGDGNADGTLDSLQTNVATFQSITGSSVTLISETGTILTNVIATVNPSCTDAPSSCTYPQGFFGFTVTGLAPRGSNHGTGHSP